MKEDEIDYRSYYSNLMYVNDFSFGNEWNSQNMETEWNYSNCNELSPLRGLRIFVHAILASTRRD